MRCYLLGVSHGLATWAACVVHVVCLYLSSFISPFLKVKMSHFRERILWETSYLKLLSVVNATFLHVNLFSQFVQCIYISTAITPSSPTPVMSNSPLSCTAGFFLFNRNFFSYLPIIYTGFHLDVFF